MSLTLVLIDVSSFKMLNLITWFLIFPHMISSGQVKKLDNGNLIITGKGCGSTTELKYLPHLPDNPEDHECVIVLKTSGKVADDKGRGYDSNVGIELFFKRCLLHRFSI